MAGRKRTVPSPAAPAARMRPTKVGQNVKHAAAFFSMLIGACVLLGDSYIKKWEPQVYASAGAQFLLRLEVPVFRDDGFEVAATILRFSPEASTYAKVGA